MNIEMRSHTPWSVTVARGENGEFCFHEIRNTKGIIIASTWAPNSESEDALLANLIVCAVNTFANRQRESTS